MKTCNRCPHYTNKYKYDKYVGYCLLKNIEFMNVIEQAKKCKHYREVR